MTAVNKYPWVKNILGDDAPLIMPGAVQAGSTQAIKRGEICVYNETSGYWVPANAAADAKYSLAIANEEQKSGDSARFIELLMLREGDVFEFELAAAGARSIGDVLTLTASNSQQLTYDADGIGVATIVGISNYPETGITTTSISYAQVMFRRDVSYFYQNVLKSATKQLITVTAATTLRDEDCGKIFSNYGAGGSVTITAQAAPFDGFNFKMVVAAAQVFAFDPKPDTACVVIKGAVNTAGKYVSVTDEGDFMEFVYDGVNNLWLCINSPSGADGDISVET